MYLKSISMKAYGPVSNLSYTFRKNEKGNPVPLVIIGKNGCGKTLMFTKDDFVEHIINNDPGFEAFSFEGFRPTLDLIKKIVLDAEEN